MIGGNAGIGFELVRILAEKNHIVYLAARNETAGKEAQCVWCYSGWIWITQSATELDCRAKLHADGLKTVKYVQLDVTNLATIEAAKETIDQAEGKLDVLVNNAGIFLAYLKQ